MIAFALSFVAGLLTSLSPCVLPALPIVVGSAGERQRSGPLALAAGMVVSFTLVGVTVAAAGPALGLDGVWLRSLAAAALVVAGVILLSERLQAQLSRRLAPLAVWAAHRSGAGESGGLGAQFGVGALLGALWSPCTGPTLGAAIGLAAQGGIPRATLLMALFGVGAALPLLAAAYAARSFRQRTQFLRKLGSGGKSVFGWVLVAVGTAVFLGADKWLERLLLDRLPAGWIDLITRF